MQWVNPFERVAFGGLILQGDDFRNRWRGLPRAERKRLTELVLATRTARTADDAALVAGRAWQLQTHYTVFTTFACVVLLVLIFGVLNGRGYLAGAVGAFAVAPLVHVWHIRRLTATVAKNVALLERSRDAAGVSPGPPAGAGRA